MFLTLGKNWGSIVLRVLSILGKNSLILKKYAFLFLKRDRKKLRPLLRLMGFLSVKNHVFLWSFILTQICKVVLSLRKRWFTFWNTLVFGDGFVMSRGCIEQFSRRQGWLQQWHWFESCPPCFICSIQKSIVKTRIQLIVYMYFNKVHCKNDELLELISFFRDQARLNRQQKAYKI